MGHKSRTYDIKMVMTGNPPKPKPVLSDDGHVIGPDDVIIFNKFVDDMKKPDHYRVRFDIDDFDNSALRFVPTKEDVMWVQEGTACPEEPCGLPGVIWVNKIDPKGEWIEVINMDMTELRFQFTLNFVDKTITNPTKNDYVALDPGGGNQNGGVPPFTVETLGACAVTGGIVGLGASMLASNALEPSGALIFGLGGALVGLIVGFVASRF